MDSVRFSSCETNLRKRDIHLTDTAVWNLHRVVYFAPDSTGRQYPKTVTSLQMDYRRALADTGKVMVRNKNKNPEKKNTEKKKSTYYVKKGIKSVMPHGIVTLISSRRKEE